MQAHISCFWTQKAGLEPREYEDGYAVSDDCTDGEWDSSKPLHLAVADGASESFLAKAWAKELTSRYADLGRATEAIRQAIAAWPELLADYSRSREAAGRPLQWFEENKMQAGAHATLVSASFLTSSADRRTGRVVLAALGDACVFVVRDDQLRLSFPMTAADQFGTSPMLVQSRPRDIELTLARVQRSWIRWRSGDSFYFATDALAHWVLAEVEAGERPWEELRDLGTTDSVPFIDWVEGLRANQRIHNDDVTLVRVDVL